MADLMKVRTVCCESNWDWSKTVKGSGDNEYHIHFSVHTGYHCSCPGFKYRGTCKHVSGPAYEALEEERCGWGLDAFANHIYDNKVCPECGGPVHPFYVGV